MRKAMIGITAMLALIQIWPAMFGQRSAADLSVPAAHAAASSPIPTRRGAASAWETTTPPACAPQYRETLAACTKGDRACSNKAVNAWDVCEATGFWPQ
ncbi:hypothetical protein U1738_01835 [Sphingomonas sp. GB1N7]